MRNRVLEVKGKYLRPCQHDASNQTAIELSEDAARRWYRRLLSERIGESVCLRHKLKIRRCNQNGVFFYRRKFKLLHLCRELLFLLGFSSSGNRFTKTARMFAVESLFRRLSKGTTAKIICEHPCPRNGLKHGPMRTHRCKHSQNHQRIAKLSKHDTTLTTSCTRASRICCPRKGIMICSLNGTQPPSNLIHGRGFQNLSDSAGQSLRVGTHALCVRTPVRRRGKTGTS